MATKAETYPEPPTNGFLMGIIVVVLILSIISNVFNELIAVQLVLFAILIQLIRMENVLKQSKQ